MYQFCILEEAEYAAFASSHPLYNFMNSVEAMHQKAKTGWKCEYAGLKKDGVLQIATPLVSMPIMKFFRYYYCQRGFLADYTDLDALKFFVHELKAYTRRNKGLYLLMDPNVLHREYDIDGNPVENGFDHSNVTDNLIQAGFIHQGYTRNYQVFAMVNWMFSLYLNGKDENTVLKEMHQQTRWSLNRTIKQGIEVRELGIDELDLFLDMEKKTAARRGFEMRDVSFYRTQMESYGPHAKVLLAYLNVDTFEQSIRNEKQQLDKDMEENEARLQETPGSKKFQKKKKVLLEALELNEKKATEAIELRKNYGSILNMATSFFMVYDNEITYLYSAANEEFKKYYAPYAIQWYMIRYALAHNIPRYNFYGISGNFDPEASDYGVYEFKKGFNGQVEELLGDFILPLRPMMYQIYTCLKSKH